MGLRILHDPDAERAVLYCTTSERALPHESFMGTDAVEQAEHFLRWLEAEKNIEDPRKLLRVTLDVYVSEWHDTFHNDEGEFDPDAWKVAD
jgi:hypothetical protein